MSNDHAEFANQLEAYLDDMLGPEERRRFEQRLAEDVRLREEVALDRRIGESLSKQFAAPEVDKKFVQLLRAQASDTVGNDAGSVGSDRRRWLLAAAAILVCASAWTVLAVRHFVEPERPPLYVKRPLAEIYEQTVSDGFEPLWLCEDDHEFASTFYERQGQGLLLAALPAGTRMAGLSYPPGFTPQTTAMLAWVAETPVMVFVEREERIDKAPEPPSAESGLNMFRKEIRGLSIIEITPLGEPQLMDYFYAAEVPEADSGSATQP